MPTTNEKYGPGKFTLITQAQCGDTIPAATDARNELVLKSLEDDDVNHLTATQRSPEWFNKRQFRITGTSAHALWKHFARLGKLARDPEKEFPDHFITVFRVLSLRINNEQYVANNEEVADRIFTRMELSEMSVASLKDVCRLKSLPVSGTKTRIIERILHADGSQSQQEQQPGAVLQLLLEKWFMTPFASSSTMREGTLTRLMYCPKFHLFSRSTVNLKSQISKNMACYVPRITTMQLSHLMELLLLTMTGGVLFLLYWRLKASARMPLWNTR
jgi:hypothetical protein